MNPFEKLSFLPRKSSPQTFSGRVAIVHWDRDSVSFFVLTPNSRSVKSTELGALSLVAESTENTDSTGEEPKRLKPLSVLADHFKTQKIAVKGIVVLLSRPELDLLPLNLPPASAEELPVLVAAEVEQQQGESQVPPIVDFYLVPEIPSDGTNTTSGQQVFAFALSQNQLASIQEQCNEAGLKLLGIGSRQLAPLRILKEVSVDADSMVVAVHLLAGEAEIAICYGKVPVLLRTIRYSSEDADRVAEQIDTEAKRCLTLLPSTVTDQPVSWCIFVNSEFARSVGEAVEQQDQVYVQWVDPYYGWNVTGNPIELSAKSAANAGAALDILSQSLPVNLLAPKRPPKPPNPWVRWGAIGGLGVASASVAGYFLLTDIWDLQSEAKSLDSNLRNEAKVTSKYQEKADQVTTVEAWLSDQVDWVAELSDLASRLPDGQEATVRRLSGSVNAKGSGSIDLAMQVRSQEIISDLENRIRGAKYTIISKQITQNPDSQEYPWQFESHIEFPLTAPGLRRFEAIEATEKAKPDKPAASTEKSAEPVEPQATSETPVPTPPTIQPPTTQPPDIPPTESPTEPTNQSNNQSNNQTTVVPAEVKS
jgi:hypothetical protein